MRVMMMVLAGLAIAALAVTLVFSVGFSRLIARAEAALQSGPVAYLRDDLPAPLAVFARRGMAGASDPAALVRLTQEVEMRLSKGGGWTAMEARQVISTTAPGFVWTAAVRAGPLPLVRVVDAYVEGQGALEVRALGAFRMGREAGPEADRGEAMRYLAELPWSPDAILSNPVVIWDEPAPGQVSAALALADGPAVVRFTFDTAGDIVGMEAEDRPRIDNTGAVIRMGWRGRFWDYAEIGGRRIALRGEVGWIYDTGYEAYWRGRINGYALSGE